MTCIVGIKAGKRVFMGADSAASSDTEVTVRKDTKMFAVGSFLMGGAGSYRMIQLLKYQFRPPAIETDIEEYMCTSFIETMRAVLGEAGCASIINNTHTIDGSMLVAYKDRLFEIHADYQVGETASGVSSIGSGSSYALGALHVLPLSMKPEKRIEAALSAAEMYNTGVRAPFHIMST